MIELNTIRCGDCMVVMKDIDSDSVDCIVTDPPYGMSFMGKNWDKAVPSVVIWQECLRVLKPGAFAFIMCIPRQDCLARMICRLEDAGFNVAFSSIYHTFAQGFPKAQNLSKIADKRAGAKRETKGRYVAPDGKTRSGGSNFSAGNKVHNPSNYDDRFLISLPTTLQAKAVDGAYGGFQPKPAVEVIIVAMKPLEEKTYVDQALSNGHGCTWLDDCRIPFDKEIEPRKRWLEPSANKEFIRHNHTQVLPGLNGHTLFSENTQKGRFPANVLCEADVRNDGVERKTGDVKPHLQIPSLFCVCNKCTGNHTGDNGSFSRYFSLDAWVEERIKQLPKEAQKTFPFMIIPKASKSEKDRGLKGKSNIHPTCKNIKLMSWLITLASREGDTVLDPFCGSGTTAIAAKMLGRQYIGIEREEDYCEIARKRVSAIPANLSRFR